jgi:DNA-binding NtrC family response regulator
MSEKTAVLIVDDSEDTRAILQRTLGGRGFYTAAAGSVASAVRLLETRAFDLVITDVRMPEQDGYQLLRHVRDNYRDLEVLVMTGFPQLEDAVMAVKNGAEEYLVKPFTEAELLAAVDKVLIKVAAGRKLAETTIQAAYHGLIGQSPAARELVKAMERAARTSATVLLQGESGTGKEVVARAIHYNSSRASAPFIPVNCAAIPEQLLESELFGHIKGAFTGAGATRAGFFQAADRGTILMDEIGEASLTMQAKLLRVIQDKEVCMVGSTKTQQVDVRLIASTNKNLPDLMKKGAFREDLYYRLNVINIHLPPLRERGDDVLLLINHFSRKAAEEFGRPVPVFSQRALQAFQAYRWPGNIRELENVIQSLVAMMEDHHIQAPDLPALMRFSASTAGGPQKTLAEMEQEYIQSVLEQVNGNKTQAARILGVDRKTLREKLKRL